MGPKFLVPKNTALRRVPGALRRGEGTDSHCCRLSVNRMLRGAVMLLKPAHAIRLTLRMAATMEPALLGRLAAAIMMGARKIRRGDGFGLWNELVKREGRQVGGGQEIPEREGQPVDAECGRNDHR